MDQKEVSQNQTKYIQFRLSEEQYNKAENFRRNIWTLESLCEKISTKSHLKKLISNMTKRNLYY